MDTLRDDLLTVMGVASTLLSIPIATPRLQRQRSTPGAVVPDQVFKNQP